MVAELAVCAVVILGLAAERLHARRVRQLAPLAFGPQRRPETWARAAPWLRVLALAALTWGLLTLWQLPARAHRAAPAANTEPRHLLLVLDVSPSMALKDAGPGRNASRTTRARQILQSFFERTPVELYRLSVVAVYTEAKPVVVDTADLEVIRNIMQDLPMSYAFKPGDTNLFAGLEEAARLAKPWQPGSTTVLVVSDGDTVPALGLPKMPAAVAHVLVVGVGDARAGSYIDGKQSRQDVSTLRQLAVRLGGRYHNGNEQHLPTSLLQEIALVRSKSVFERLTRREYALLACGLGAGVLALLPVALQRWGTRWSPGVPTKKGDA